jgi:hypothetical protein
VINIDPSLLSAAPHTAGEVLADTRRFYELMAGERFKALILDIRPGEVTIRLDGGGKFTARSLVLPEARIGEDALFIVKENDMKGHILLEMGKLTTTARQDNMLKEALRHAGMHVNEETLALGRAMLDNHLPVNAHSLQRAAFYRFTPSEGANTPMDGVVFLLKENFPLEQQAVNVFNKVLSQPKLLLESVTKIIDEAAALPEGQRVAVLKTLLPEIFEKTPVREIPAREVNAALHKMLFLPLYGAKPTLRRYYRELGDTLQRLDEAVQVREASEPLSPGLKEAVANARDTVKLMEYIDTGREYYQIPFIAQPDGQARMAELHVFKDKKPSGDGSRSYSALISLDTVGLKHTEVYIQKTGGQASLVFRCDTDRALSVLSAAGSKLTQALKEKNIAVSALSFSKITEPFELTDQEPYTEPPKQENVKRFTFDMRV